MILLLVVLLLAFMFSFFFSGSETGFYRVTRMRLVLDGMSGSWNAKGLLWLSNNPAVFVTTVLVGNNIANYAFSNALVQISQSLTDGLGDWFNVAISILLSPLLFIYGELLPKSLFYNAPYLLLRRVAPLFILCAILLSPISIVLYFFSRAIQSAVGQAPLQVRPALARQELHRVLEEGRQAGVLAKIQQDISQNLLTYGGKPLRNFCMPLRGMPLVEEFADRTDLLETIRRSTHAIVGVRRSDGQLLGYYRVIDILTSPQMPSLQEVPTLLAEQSHISALTQLQSQHAELARVVDQKGTQIGIVTYRRLTELMLNRA